MDPVNGRRNRQQRDADTVEIMYALASAAFLATVGLGVTARPARVWHLPPGLTVALLLTGLMAGGVLAVTRVVHVLRQHAKRRAPTPASMDRSTCCTSPPARPWPWP